MVRKEAAMSPSYPGRRGVNNSIVTCSAQLFEKQGGATGPFIRPIHKEINYQMIKYENLGQKICHF